MSEQRIDHAAGSATGRPGDEVPGVGDALADEAGTAVQPGERRGPGGPSSVPGVGRAELGEQEDVPETEGARQAVETVRSISRLEESS